jgi:hypothetical protein
MILCLSAWKGSGKDTVAKILVEKYGFTRLAFADVLKDMVAEQYGIDRESLDDPSRKESPILSMPVETKDKFGEMIHNFMIGEFRHKDGSRPDSSVKEAQLFAMTGRTLFWTPRALAILEGSVKRSANSSYWVQRALGQIEPGKNYVITDMRYRSELSQIAEYSDKSNQELKTLRVERYDASPSSDPSERDLDDTRFDLTMDNRGSVKDLEASVESLVKELL